MPVVAACAALHRAGHRQEPRDQTRSGCGLVELSLLLAPARRALPTQAPSVAETWGSEDGASSSSGMCRQLPALTPPAGSSRPAPRLDVAGVSCIPSILLQLWPLSNLCFGL